MFTYLLWDAKLWTVHVYVFNDRVLSCWSFAYHLLHACNYCFTFLKWQPVEIVLFFHLSLPTSKYNTLCSLKRLFSPFNNNLYFDNDRPDYCPCSEISREYSLIMANIFLNVATFFSFFFYFFSIKLVALHRFSFNLKTVCRVLFFF